MHRVWFLLLPLVCTGCVVGPSPTPNSSAAFTETIGERLTVVKLQSLLMDYADRYASLVASTSDDIRSIDPSPESRRAANLLKLVNCTAVFSTAASPNPQVGLLDMVVHTSLIRGRFREGAAKEIFKEQAPLVLAAYDTLFEDAWELATQALSDDQLDELGNLINHWRKTHPQYKYLSNIRFSDFADTRYLSTLADTKEGGISLARLMPLPDIDQATRELREARMLGERASFLAMRMPTLMRWQIEVVSDQILTTVEMKQSLSDFTNLSKATTRMSATIEGLPKTMEQEERHLRELLVEFQKTFAAGEKLVSGVTASAVQVQKTSKESQETAAAITTAIKSSDEILDRFSSTTKPTRFAVEKFTQSFEKAKEASEELNKLAVNLDKLVQTMSQNDPSQLGFARSLGLIDHFAWRMFQLAAAVSGLVIVTRLIGRRGRRRAR